MILKPLLHWMQRTSLVTQIVMALIAGIAFAFLWPAATPSVGLLGKLFISALKAVAPVLVLILVMASISNHRPGDSTLMRPVLWLYVIGTLAAAIVGVFASMLFPSTLVLQNAAVTDAAAPGNVQEVLMALVLSAVDNPVNALLTANYIGILVWAVGLGLALRHASEGTRKLLGDLSNAITLIIQGVIRCAPLGIFGLVAATFADAGTAALLGYAHLLTVLVGCMLFVALVVNPLIVFAKIRLLAPDLHVISVCQPTVPVLAAISLMASQKDDKLPKTMTMMGGPISGTKVLSRVWMLPSISVLSSKVAIRPW